MTDQFCDFDHPKRHGLEHHGFKNVGNVYWTPTTPTLYEQVVRRREGILCHLGPIAVRTGHHTGRSPDDKFIVKEPTSEDHVWWGDVNKPFEQERFNALYQRLMAYVQGRDLFVQDCFVGADPQYSMPIRVITENAWQSLFTRNMFIQIKDRAKLDEHRPEFRVLAFPHFHALPELDKTNSEAFIIVDFGQKTVMIGGTSYAGEIKKSVFTILNYYLPQQEVLSMHCSANMGRTGDVALFFGLSGTGKTTLSADVERRLIGDDEHGWSDNGIFNFEGGCYAKVINLSREAEPEIYECTRRFGTILENVMVDNETRRVDLDDATLTENTRAGYPISHLPNAIREGRGPHPKNIVLLTCDAFGVLPAISKLTTEQAMYQFLSGYTARVAGTESGMGSEPKATFSACFGAPFMALPPTFYTQMFGDRVRKHNVKCWLVNTGWQGGSAASGAKRISIQHTRALVRAALSGALDDVPTVRDPLFGVEVPTECPGVPPEVLRPREQWADAAAYDVQAATLVGLFQKNMDKFRGQVADEIIAAGPQQRS
ncbi:phosphoenolpyruvate carboxykinase (ATP) [bacterium]|nr:phosphoenolpyruvate carboxykinase (ATP) [bacterium]